VGIATLAYLNAFGAVTSLSIDYYNNIPSSIGIVSMTICLFFAIPMLVNPCRSVFYEVLK